MTEALSYEYSPQMSLSESYPMNTNMKGFKCFLFEILCPCALDESSRGIERLTPYASGGLFGLYKMMQKS